MLSTFYHFKLNLVLCRIFLALLRLIHFISLKKYFLFPSRYVLVRNLLIKKSYCQSPVDIKNIISLGEAYFTHFMSGTQRIQIAREWSVTLTNAVLIFHFPEYTGFRVERNFCEDVFLGLANLRFAIT